MPPNKEGLSGRRHASTRIINFNSQPLRPAPKAGAKRITWEELAAKNGSDGTYWICIYNEVYDVTDFLATHPGGSIIEIGCGRDATALFEANHPATCLQRVIFAVDNKVPHVGTIAEPVPQADDKFYRTLRSRVDKYLTDNNINRYGYGWAAIAELFLTLVLYFVASYYASFHGSWIAVIFFGFFTGRLGLYQHFGNHCSMTKSAVLNDVTSLTMDILGGNSFLWRYEHNVAHHCAPNELGVDNDCEIGNPYLRFHPDLEHFVYQRWNAYVTFVGMTFGTLKWFVSDFVFVFSGKIGNVSFHAEPRHYMQLVVSKAFFLVFHILIPAYYFGWTKAISMWVVAFAIGGHYLENIFIVNHIQSGLLSPPGLHWADHNAYATANWSSGSVFWNLFSGGLNHQIEHHLFPTMNFYIYPKIAHVVKDTCKEFNLPYHEYPNFASAWLETFRYLDKLGREAKPKAQ